jgi:hypothetical protein
MPGRPLFIPRYQLFIVSLIAFPECRDLHEHRHSAARRWPASLGGRRPLSSLADKNLVADKGPSVLVSASTNCDGTAHTSLNSGNGIQGVLIAVGSSFASRLMVGAA